MPLRFIAHAIGLYYRLHASLGEVEDLMLERGVVVSYETIHRWCRKHGGNYIGPCTPQAALAELIAPFRALFFWRANQNYHCGFPFKIAQSNLQYWPNG